MMNTTQTTSLLPSTSEAAVAEGTYQGRWARTAGLTLDDLWPLWQARCAKADVDAAIGWPAAVDAWYDAE
jgi:hypothetical protein